MQALYQNTSRTTVVCVDSYENSVLAGRFYHASCPDGAPFRSLVQLLRQMDKLLDETRFPQPFTAIRAFPEAPELRLPEPDLQLQKGRLATFSVRVLFRQNASWQGSVTWLEENREENFRSVLELVLLMDSAVRIN